MPPNRSLQELEESLLDTEPHENPNCWGGYNVMLASLFLLPPRLGIRWQLASCWPMLCSYACAVSIRLLENLLGGTWSSYYIYADFNWGLLPIMGAVVTMVLRHFVLKMMMPGLLFEPACILPADAKQRFGRRATCAVIGFAVFISGGLFLNYFLIFQGAEIDVALKLLGSFVYCALFVFLSYPVAVLLVLFIFIQASTLCFLLEKNAEQFRESFLDLDMSALSPEQFLQHRQTLNNVIKERTRLFEEVRQMGEAWAVPFGVLCGCTVLSFYFLTLRWPHVRPQNAFVPVLAGIALLCPFLSGALISSTATKLTRAVRLTRLACPVIDPTNQHGVLFQQELAFFNLDCDRNPIQITFGFLPATFETAQKIVTVYVSVYTVVPATDTNRTEMKRSRTQPTS